MLKTGRLEEEEEEEEDMRSVHHRATEITEKSGGTASGLSPVKPDGGPLSPLCLCGETQTPIT